MKKIPLLLVVLAVTATNVAGQDRTSSTTSLFNPYERVKNGPPLTNVFQKAKPEWIWSKLREPQHDPSAHMPDFDFNPEEILDIMAYLKSIQEPPEQVRDWPAWADKGFDDLEDDEFEEMFELSDGGLRVWSDARCSICHSINGPGGKIVGGVVELRVGGIDLQIAASKLNRDWLFSWIREPKDYFPDTLMPHFRLSDDEIAGLVEYILRDDAFIPPEEEYPGRPEHWDALARPERAERGKALMELSRCVVCHDVKGLAELLVKPVREVPADRNSFEFLAYDLRCLTCHTIEGRGGTYAPDLSSEGSRLVKDWIEQFVENPDMIRPLSQQMPKFNLTHGESQTAPTASSAGLAAFQRAKSRTFSFSYSSSCTRAPGRVASGPRPLRRPGPSASTND